jgi:uncharacterized ferritin-like protein (DUF455 family)
VTVSIAQACRGVLLTASARSKVMASREVARLWRRGAFGHAFDVEMPDRPARPDRPALLPPNRMPKRGRAGSDRSRIALLHALAHIEFGAIDLAFDMAGRFGAAFPRSFIDDWLSVGADEALHFALLDRRLRSLGAGYGALPAHDGLWEAAAETAHDAGARLAVVPMVLEARGLDVTPATLAAFERVGDSRSAAILNRIYRDEIRHVAIGTNWFKNLCDSRNLAAAPEWRRLIRLHFRGIVKPPFNDSARGQAGLSRDFYAGVAPGEPA